MARSRFRILNDSFWGDPKLANLETEQRLALMLLLTNENANAIGVYPVVWRALGAGIGWTEQQMKALSKDLQTKGLIDIMETENESGWVWVKEWWKHNSLKAAFSGNVARKAREELRAIPANWKTSVPDWIYENDSKFDLKELAAPLL